MPIYITVLVSQEESGLQIAFEIFCKLQLPFIDGGRFPSYAVVTPNYHPVHLGFFSC